MLTHSLLVNLLSGFYLRKFINNEREISIWPKALPSAVLKISSSLLVSKVGVNPDNS